MALPQPEEKTTKDQVLRLVSQLTPESQEEVIEELKLQWLQRELQKGIDQADRGEVVEGDEVFRQLRELNASFRHKGSQ